MTRNITHQKDADTGHYRQIVTGSELRRLLRRDGDSLKRPTWFSSEDEWDTGTTDAEVENARLARDE
jgi:hypothetical protein